MTIGKVFLSLKIGIYYFFYSGSSEYSDWAEEEGRKTLRPPPSRTRREKRGRRKLKIKDEDEDIEVDVEAEEELTKITRKIRKARVIHDDDVDIYVKDIQLKVNYDEDMFDHKDVKPSTSADLSPRKGRPPKRTTKKFDKEIERHKLETTIAKDMKECPPEFRPPEWLTSTKPRKSPYAPQIGDEVVYFRQGHEIYVDTVKLQNSYEMEERSFPWLLDLNINVRVCLFVEIVSLIEIFVFSSRLSSIVKLSASKLK